METSLHDPWPSLASHPLCQTPWLTVTRETIASPSRPQGTEWTVVQRAVAAVVAPRTSDGHYVLIRQERLPARREFWEFPAGQVEGEASETAILDTAARELGEEAALLCRTPLLPLGRFYSSPGFSDECCHLFLADGVESAPDLRQHDANEAIHEVRHFSPQEFVKAVGNGEICDANTLACFARLQALGIFFPR